MPQQPQLPTIRNSGPRVIVDPVTGDFVLAQPNETDQAAFERAKRTTPIAPQGPLNLSMPGRQPTDLKGITADQMFSTVIKLVGLGGAMAIPPAGWPALLGRAAVTGGSGAAADAVEGDNPWTGGILGALSEIGGAGMGHLAPIWGVKIGNLSSGAAKTLPEKEEMLGAYLRERARSPLGRATPIGAQANVAGKLEGMQKEFENLDTNSILTVPASAMRGTGAQTARQQIDERLPAHIFSAEVSKKLGETERRMLENAIMTHGGWKRSAVSQMSDRDLLFWADMTDVNVGGPGGFADFVKTQKKSGRAVVQARKAGAQVSAEDAPITEQFPSALGKEGDLTLDSMIPGRAKLQERYSDMKTLEKYGNKSQDPFSRRGIRAGAGAGLGGGLGLLLGMNPGTTAAVGGALGFGASPRVLSNFGSGLGHFGSMFPRIQRSADILEDISRMLTEEQQKKQAKEATRRRQGGK